MAKVIFRTAKVSIFFVCILALIASAFLLVKIPDQAQADQEGQEITYPEEQIHIWEDYEQILERNEVISARDENTRLWEIVKEVAVNDPETNRIKLVEKTSYIEEKGCGICYQDLSGSWQVTDTSWHETEYGFVM